MDRAQQIGLQRLLDGSGNGLLVGIAQVERTELVPIQSARERMEGDGPNVDHEDLLVTGCRNGTSVTTEGRKTCITRAGWCCDYVVT